jgi:hypothetical protein
VEEGLVQHQVLQKAQTEAIQFFQLSHRLVEVVALLRFHLTEMVKMAALAVADLLTEWAVLETRQAQVHHKEIMVVAAVIQTEVVVEVALVLLGKILRVQIVVVTAAQVRHLLSQVLL